MGEKNVLSEGIETLREAIGRYGTDLQAYRSLGNIRVVQHPTEPYLLFNYTEKAVFEGIWNAVEQAARGIIFDYQSGELVALPFQKFWNLEERPETSLVHLPDAPCEITAKLDGSLGILYWTLDGQPTIATRGSFTSEQAVWATQFFRRKAPRVRDEDATYLFEIIYPQNRVVLDYGKEENLYLIGAKDRISGFDYPHEWLQNAGDRLGFPVVERWQMERLVDLLPLARERKGIEGWVARFPDGFRVKLKTEEYLQLHRLISHLTPQHVRDLLLVSQDAWQSYLESLPDEFQGLAKGMAQKMLDQVRARSTSLRATFAQIKELATISRKTYALAVMSEHRADSGYLFALLDEKPILASLLKDLDLAAMFQEQQLLEEEA